MLQPGSILGAVLLAASLAGGTGGAEPPDPTAPETWEIDGADLYGVASRGDRVWAVGYWGTLLRSLDGGASWERPATPTRRTLFDVDFADDLHGLVVGENGTVLRSADGGASWVRQEIRIEDETGEARPLDVHLFGVAALSPRRAFAVGDLGLVLHTRDGLRWERQVLPEEVFADGEIPDRILNAVAFHDRERGWIAGEFGTVLRTRDGGETWSGERRFEGLPPDLYLYDVAARDASGVAAAGPAGQIALSDDGGRSWVPRASGLGAAIYALAWSDARAVAVGDRGEIAVSLDGGGSWSPARRPPLFDWLADVGGAGTTLFAVGERGVVLRSRDAGRSWQQLRGPRTPSAARERPAAGER